MKTQLLINNEKNNNPNLEWNEKYRPKSLDEITGQEKIVNFYQQQINAYYEVDTDGKPKLFKMRNAIFKGRCGVGKTSLARVLANEFDVKMIEINGSDDRSLNKIRERIVNNFKYAPIQGRFKLFVVEETENVMNEAWMLLKSPIENTKTSTVIFLCNNDANIPEAIVSRCDVHDFAPIGKNDVIKRLKQIVEKEHFILEDKIATIIYEKTMGDMRKAVAILENYHSGSIKLGENEFDDIFVAQ
jgi:DNA polymerase III gamma/tau subunit